MKCHNCDNLFREGDAAYQIERGRVEFDHFNKELVFACGARPCPTFITLCAVCYDDNWLIGEPLPKNQHLVDR
jgi:hypothetical protein